MLSTTPVIAFILFLLVFFFCTDAFFFQILRQIKRLPRSEQELGELAKAVNKQEAAILFKRYTKIVLFAWIALVLVTIVTSVWNAW